ncbi:MAG: crosslink repair DNA glycosylase YcaQ family protein [Chloroflexota bacterium]
MAGPARLTLDRAAILAQRRRATFLDERLPAGAASWRAAAFAGLTDSMPRAALLSLHARVAGVPPDVLDDPALAQVWGPRFSAYVVAADDVAPFTLGRLPVGGARRRSAEDVAERLRVFLDGRRMPFGAAARGMGESNANYLRYATLTGTVRIRWDGARQPEIWCVPPPAMTAEAARLELVRRYLRAFGVGTTTGFGDWAGVKETGATATFEALAPELVPVRTPVGDAWILAADEAAFRGGAVGPAGGAGPGARLLASGDTFFLLQGVDREVLVPDAAHRAELWTTRVWPGAVLLGGEVVGTWRRPGSEVIVAPWRPFSGAERAAVEAEVAALPLPGLTGPLRVRWPSD